MEHLPKKNLFRNVGELARLAGRLLSTQPLATHGEHNFDHHVPFEEIHRERYWPGEPTQEIDLNELNAHMWGNTFENMHTGPEFYNRQGYPIWPQDLEALHKAEPLLHLFSIEHPHGTD